MRDGEIYAIEKNLNQKINAVSSIVLKIEENHSQKMQWLQNLGVTNSLKVQALVDVMSSRPPRFKIWKWGFGKKPWTTEEVRLRYVVLAEEYNKNLEEKQKAEKEKAEREKQEAERKKNEEKPKEHVPLVIIGGEKNENKSQEASPN